jgi:hypothetical protein
MMFVKDMSLQGLYDLYHVLASQITINEKYRPLEKDEHTGSLFNVYDFRALYIKFDTVTKEINSRIDYKNSEK